MPFLRSRRPARRRVICCAAVPRLRARRGWPKRAKAPGPAGRSDGRAVGFVSGYGHLYSPPVHFAHAPPAPPRRLAPLGFTRRVDGRRAGACRGLAVAFVPRALARPGSPRPAGRQVQVGESGRGPSTRGCVVARPVRPLPRRLGSRRVDVTSIRPGRPCIRLPGRCAALRWRQHDSAA